MCLWRLTKIMSTQARWKQRAVSEQKIPLSGPIVTWDQLLSPLQHDRTEHSRKGLSPAKKRLQISVIQTLVLCIWHGKHSYSYDLCWPSNKSNDYWNLPQARQDFTSLVLISSIITTTVWSNYYYPLFHRGTVIVGSGCRSEKGGAELDFKPRHPFLRPGSQPQPTPLVRKTWNCIPCLLFFSLMM